MVWDLFYLAFFAVFLRIGGFRTAASAREAAESEWPLLKAAAAAGSLTLPQETAGTQRRGWQFLPSRPGDVDDATVPVARTYDAATAKPYTKVKDLPGFPRDLARQLRGLKEIGRGATGIVYRVQFPAWDSRDFVLKHVIPPTKERARDTKKEIDIMRSLGHLPGFVTYLGSVHSREVKPGENVYIMMEKATDTFHNVLHYGLPHEKTWPLFVDIVRAVHEMHRRGIAHHDIKPANVLIIGDCASEEVCSAVLCDLSMACTGSFGRWPTDQEREPMGTIPYIEPDQSRRSNCETGDMWALGVMLYQVVFGCMVEEFSGISDLDLIREVSQDFRIQDDERFKTLPPSLSKLMAGLLHRDPTKRIGSGEALRQAVEISRLAGSRVRPPQERITVELAKNASAILGEWSADGPVQEKRRLELFPLFRQAFN
mmetsp:Transcript_22230/g.63609  ORF Transcript_22230/g.63609 Transcript_22230/m.63609 type:complete len:428 (-) Transcript_22230:115-1398(-)